MNIQLLRVQVLLLLAAAALLPACGAPQVGEPSTAPTRQMPLTAAPKTHKLTPGKYIAADSINVRALLPDPADAGSPMTRGEIELVLAIQADASPAARARCLSENKMTPWIFADVLGPSFNPQQMPLTADLLDQAEADGKVITEAAKKYWARPRPSDQDPRIQVRSDKPGNKSYPSGHATRATTWARILTLLAPNRAEELAARARLVSSDRIVAGVHLPSDVAAGYVLGNAIADRLLENVAFRRDLEAARAEWSHMERPTPGTSSRGTAQ